MAFECSDLRGFAGGLAANYSVFLGRCTVRKKAPKKASVPQHTTTVFSYDFVNNFRLDAVNDIVA